MIELFIKGILIGFLVAIPVGPIGLLCIQRTLTNGYRIGLASGFGAALADGFFSLLASLGLTAVVAALMSHRSLIETLGGMGLIALGVKMLSIAPKNARENGDEQKSWHALTTTFLLTLSNPITIFAFIAIFASLGIGALHHGYELILSAGVMIGSACWWLLLCSLVFFILHHRLSDKAFVLLNRISAALFIGFGLFILLVAKRVPWSI